MDFDLIKLGFQWSWAAGLMLFCVMLVGWAAHNDLAARIREPGPDRDALIGWLREDSWRERYRQATTSGLDRLDKWLGDAGQPSLSWQTAFGRRPPGPDWTAPALDRCALLAVVYPVLTLFLIWMWTGDAGPVGNLLGFASAVEWPQRVFVGLAGLAMGIAMRRSDTSSGWQSVMWFAVAVAVGVGGIGAGPGPATAILAVACAGSFAVAVGVVFVLGFVLAFVLGFAFVGARLGAFSLHQALVPLKWHSLARQRLFWLVFAPVMGLLAYFALGLLAANLGPRDKVMLALILTFTILPLVNLPFDFFSLGLTRALLRWSGQPGAPSPFLIGLLDTLVALVLILPLMAALVLAVQAADALVFWQSGGSFVVLPHLLDSIAASPWDASHFWVYFMLGSTLIPSIVNACIGTLSLSVILIPPMRAFLLSHLQAAQQRPEDWKGHGAKRFWVITLCVGQVVGSALVTMGAFLGLGWLAVTVLPGLLPWLLAAARWFAVTSGAWFGLPPYG